MMLERAFAAILSALIWLFDLLFMRAFLLTLAIGCGALLVLVVWRSRRRP
jgi:hypothetical protein